MAESKNSNLVWMDLEMTGLDPDVDTILEIATLITDADLHVIAEGPNLAVHQPDSVLEGMGEWCKQHHGESGLTERVRRSTVSIAQAEAQTLEFISQYVPERTSPLCGNSIHQDRRFLVRYMPEIESYLHYRNIDVSTIKELVNRWYPKLPMQVKEGKHLALADIHESIRELRYYRQKIFSRPDSI
ncbi:MAG: oligoribonuclease [Mariprofundaceae bacterium]|nr:oligoribonuclease [Mariprofundaceae bacterium]